MGTWGLLPPNAPQQSGLSWASLPKSGHDVVQASPLERYTELGCLLGVELTVKRDDLLPFPLAGNKFRKLERHLADAGAKAGDALITVGGVRSNHCRTAALLAARQGLTAHVILHAADEDRDQRSPSLSMLQAAGAHVY